jgi:hypothetical protein
MTCTPAFYNCYNKYNGNFSETNPDTNNINTVCDKNFPVFVKTYSCTDPPVASSSGSGLTSDQFHSFMSVDVIIILCLGVLIGYFSLK